MTSKISDSLWFNTCQESEDTKPLTENAKADLVIIGGGYTGLSAALEAAQGGASVRVLEAESIGFGGSGRNVGLSNAGLWLPPDEINATIGLAAGERLSRILAQAPDKVFDLIARHEIACEPVRNGTLHCAHAPTGLSDLQNRFRQQTARGAPVQLLSREEAIARTGSDQVHGALFDPRAGTIQPLAYAVGLARAAQTFGAILHSKTPALDVKKAGALWTVQTPRGTVTAKKMIIAMNGYAIPIQGLKTPKVIPVHYFQSATAPLSVEQAAQILPGKEGCWDTAMVMSSWRMDQDGRLIIGGMGQLGHIGQSAHLGWLKRKLTKMYPLLAEVTLQETWFGRIAMTEEYLPKTLLLDNSALINFGYSGRGIGPGTVFGTAMAQALLGGDLSVMPRAPIAQHNIAFAGVRQAYYEAGATLTHLVKDRV
ncbi:NAD(P)/FAD-dependent oxidoreductase [Pelagimonas varians]|uniref:Gamma-glutamylputrescine oxidoreductase n=1 Tax=Pelagimonas varians TaxID=696760 RepID=A0A238KJ44_9RHOB|nr:FAD-binding oxidoreductase [Pelagimonas varians]PYG29578.1 glycine/D-amino acid oxidase-like deaminating enzyme [Pelagimonas varians]SMX42740.1 Gamma-glutamylputrescine oxidoreductase [Pelagimonas varians]